MIGRLDIQSIVVPLIAISIGPVVALATGDPYALTTYERALIYAVAVSSLNLILGYGGMVSFGHAVFLGLGAYTTGILANEGVTDLWIQIPAVIVVCALSAALIGVIALRTSGVYFIMITLALAQIFYYVAVSTSTFGGDDGLVIYDRTTLFGYDPYDSWQFYWFVALTALVLIWLVAAISRSDFGLRLVATRENAKRAGALGLHVFGTRLAAFVIAGVICGLAGLLLANQTEFASPGYANWRRSGELLAIVILGGVGLRMGPIYGAFAFTLIEHELASFTNHWPIVFGPLLILVVLFFRSGLGGFVESLFRRRKRGEPAPAPATEGA